MSSSDEGGDYAPLNNRLQNKATQPGRDELEVVNS